MFFLKVINKKRHYFSTKALPSSNARIFSGRTGLFMPPYLASRNTASARWSVLGVAFSGYA